MVGRDLENRFPDHEPHIGEELLRIEDWTVHHPLDRARRSSTSVEPLRPRAARSSASPG